MNRIISASLICFASILFISCQKANSNPAAKDITGTYTFVSMDVTTESSEEYTDASGNQKTVTTSAYTTEDNTGTVTIDATTMTTTNIAYSVNTTIKTDFYMNGTLVNRFELPFTYTAPASSSTGTYHTIKADSIYFEGGTVFMSGAFQQSIPCGAKVEVSGNMLYLTASLSQTTNEVIGGINNIINVNATSRVKLQKQ